MAWGEGDVRLAGMVGTTYLNAYFVLILNHETIAFFQKSQMKNLKEGIDPAKARGNPKAALFPLPCVPRRRKCTGLNTVVLVPLEVKILPVNK